MSIVDDSLKAEVKGSGGSVGQESFRTAAVFVPHRISNPASTITTVAKNVL
jgi:hypothetical protein